MAAVRRCWWLAWGSRVRYRLGSASLCDRGRRVRGRVLGVVPLRLAFSSPPFP